MYGMKLVKFYVMFVENFQEVFFFRGMNPLHMLGAYGKDNSSAILELFKEYLSDYDLNQKDAKGNSGKKFKKISC